MVKLSMILLLTQEVLSRNTKHYSIHFFFNEQDIIFTPGSYIKLPNSLDHGIGYPRNPGLNLRKWSNVLYVMMYIESFTVLPVLNNNILRILLMTLPTELDEVFNLNCSISRTGSHASSPELKSSGIGR